MLRKKAMLWQVPVAGVLALAGLVMVPSPAHAYQVSVLVTGAGTIKETTPAGLMHCTTPYSSTPITCTAGTSSGDYGWGWTVAYQATARPGYTFARWESTTSGPVICDGAEGSTSYTGATCRFTTFENLNVRAVFVDTSMPLAPTITSGPPPVTNQTSASFTFSQGDDPTAYRFEGRLDRPGQVGTWSTVGLVGSDAAESYSGLAANGRYSFSVRTVDHAGNISVPTTRSWNVDTVAPTVPVVNSPEDGAVIAGTDLTLTGVAGGDVVQVEVVENMAVVGGVPTSGPWTFHRSGLAEGTYTYHVRARDAVGNWSGPSAAVTVEVDRTAPSTVVTGPANGSYDRDGTVVLTGTSEPGATVAVTSGPLTVTDVADADGAWSLTLPGQPNGSHSYLVRGTDVAGNVFTASARTVVVDTVAPRASAVAPRPGAKRVSRKANVVVKLSERVRPGTISRATVSLAPKGSGKKVRARLTWDSRTNRVVLNPRKALSARTVYVVKVARGVTDIAGHPLAAGLRWKFRTRG